MMQVTHEFETRGTCPIDNSVDHYSVTVTLFRNCASPANIVTVEEILSKCTALLTSPCFQEDFTWRLADYLKASVSTQCYHAAGVHTTCHANFNDAEE